MKRRWIILLIFFLIGVGISLMWFTTRPDKPIQTPPTPPSQPPTTIEEIQKELDQSGMHTCSEEDATGVNIPGQERAKRITVSPDCASNQNTSTVWIVQFNNQSSRANAEENITSSNGPLANASRVYSQNEFLIVVQQTPSPQTQAILRRLFAPRQFGYGGTNP